MKRLFYTLYSLMLIMLFAGETVAQQLVGESEPFIFDTREQGAVIPLSNSVFLVFFLLAGSLILSRHYLLRRKTSV
jgi:hypothetical protein